VMWAVVARSMIPAPVDADPLIVVGVIALLYAIPGFAGRIPDLLAVGT